MLQTKYIFVKSMIHFYSLLFDEQRNTFFCNIRNVIIATFDQFNAAVLKEKYCFSFIYNFLVTPNFWMVVYIVSIQFIM